MANAKLADKPLVYSCSGCSNVAQLANDIAVWMSREGVAEMSCIAGVGGGCAVVGKNSEVGGVKLLRSTAVR